MTKAKSLSFAASLLACSMARADDPKAVTDQQLHQTVDSHMADIKACMKEHGPSKGKLVVEFAIEADGHVSSSKVGHASENGPLDSCIAGNFKKWSFPKPSNGRTWLSNYPIVFSVPKEAPKGTMAESDIVNTVKAKIPEIQACLTEAKKENADVKGTVDAGIVVSPAGAVTEVNVLKTDTKAPKLDACIVEHVKKWTFPKPQGNGEAAFHYPFKLNLP